MHYEKVTLMDFHVLQKVSNKILLSLCYLHSWDALKYESKGFKGHIHGRYIEIKRASKGYGKYNSRCGISFTV